MSKPEIQIPPKNFNEQNSKFITPVLGIGNVDLEFVWDLVLGIWN
jgi:hypothetical protein